MTRLAKSAWVPDVCEEADSTGLRSAKRFADNEDGHAVDTTVTWWSSTVIARCVQWSGSMSAPASKRPSG
jgi:hypothetical protein